MLVVIDIETKKIKRIILDNEEYNLIDIYQKGRIVGDISDPATGMKNEDGGNRLVFKELSDDEFKNGTYAFFKEVKSILISNIVVEYNGIEYQGNEESQNRISRAINSLSGIDTIQWKAKDNNLYELNKDDLIEILSLITKEQTKIYTSII